MDKIDYKKQLSNLYKPKANTLVIVDVPAMNFLMIDGQGDPNTSAQYAQAVEALFSVSYALKFMVKKSSANIDYVVMPLEGLWWADDMSSFDTDQKSQWKWTMMIMQSTFIDQSLVTLAMQSVQKKKNLPALELVRFEKFHEGKSAQLLHVGPFSEEGPSVARLHEFIAANGALAGKHHEIYLSDVRKADPSKWKTIIRQPMA